MAVTSDGQTGAEPVAWRLDDLFAGPDDPALTATMAAAQSAAEAFASRYRGAIGPGLAAATLAEAMDALEGIYDRTGRVLAFAYLQFAADTSNPRHGALLQAMQESATAVSKPLIFFDLDWVALPDAEAEALLADPGLARWRYYLQRSRVYRPHLLSEPEEAILEEKANTGDRAFTRLFDEVTNRATFRLGDQDLSQQEVLAKLYDPDRERRRQAADALTAGLQGQSHVLTYIFNVLVQDKAVDDRLRHYADPMTARHLANQIEPDAVASLVAAVEGNFGLVQRYYRLKKRLLGYDTLYDYDRYAPVGATTQGVAFAEGKRIVLEAFGRFSPQMRTIAATFFDQHWIDAALRPGKRGGAFSHSTVPSVHPYILMSYTGRTQDVMTLAHELGHGVHQFLSREQGLFHAGTPLTTAETASVFGEQLVFQALKAQASPEDRLALLCEKLESAFATVFRQIVMTRFEMLLHDGRRELGELTTEQINDYWMTANRPMFGDVVELRPDYGIWWSYISHFTHSPFYCYAYAFGELLVLALYQQYQREGEAFVPKYLAMLAAGGSMSPADLVRQVGVDITDPGFWQGGLDLLAAMVAEAEALATTLGR